jgi:DNA modification methylase
LASPATSGGTAILKLSNSDLNGRPEFVPPSNPQGFECSQIHGWYNFVLGFSDKLVSQMMDRLGVSDKQIVFDPFCGTGTTLVESMKRGMTSVGIDASPFSCFVSRVKTNRKLHPEKLLSTLVDVAIEYDRATRKDFSDSHAYKYLNESGMLKRGWISATPLRDALALKEAIYKAASVVAYRDVLLLALVANLSTQIGNMKYGPEIYCGPKKRNVNVWSIFEANASKMIRDLWAVRESDLGSASVFLGDARNCSAVLKQNGIKKIHVAISSPPYPAEHDYTRNTRLELAFLDFVRTKDSVQAIKRTMIRSHTKGIYKTDSDAELVRGYESINMLAEKVERKCRGKKYGFARLYPTVIREYFGGMRRHLKSMARAIDHGGKYAMVVGDQASYFGVHIPTAELLAEIAEDSGFLVEESIMWRVRRASTKRKKVKEHALILRRRLN